MEKYNDNTKGYHPFLIRDLWQVAQLNYLPGHGLDDITDIEAHRLTDEAFILFEGTAVLISAQVNEGTLIFEIQKMEKGITYNISAGTWHNIAMERDAQMIIVENANTHLFDCYHQELTLGQLDELYTLIKRELIK